MEIKISYYDDNSRLSNSALGWFLNSPRYYRDRLDGKIKSETTPAMENGTMTHMYLLEPTEFNKNYKILDFQTPTSAQQKQFCLDYVNSKAEKAILKASEAFKLNYSTTGRKEEESAAKGLEMALKLKSYIKWLRSNENGIKTMTWAKLNALKNIKDNVRLHKKANELLFKTENSPEIISHNEFHINWEMTVKPGTKIDCKSLIDRLIIDHENKKVTLCDIKTTMSLAEFGKSFSGYDYGRQMAFYWGAIYWYFENELKLNIHDYTHETVIIAIQNSDGAVKVFNVPDSIIESKITQIKQIVTEIDWHNTNNQWDYTREYYEGDGVESLPYDIT